jgi:hypothetical protein
MKKSVLYCTVFQKAPEKRPENNIINALLKKYEENGRSRWKFPYFHTGLYIKGIRAIPESSKLKG